MVDIGLRGVERLTSRICSRPLFLGDFHHHYCSLSTLFFNYTFEAKQKNNKDEKNELYNWTWAAADQSWSLIGHYTFLYVYIPPSPSLGMELLDRSIKPSNQSSPFFFFNVPPSCCHCQAPLVWFPDANARLSRFDRSTLQLFTVRLERTNKRFDK